jgi:hypothetical protein
MSDQDNDRVVDGPTPSAVAMTHALTIMLGPQRLRRWISHLSSGDPHIRPEKYFNTTQSWIENYFLGMYVSPQNNLMFQNHTTEESNAVRALATVQSIENGQGPPTERHGESQVEVEIVHGIDPNALEQRANGNQRHFVSQWRQLEAFGALPASTGPIRRQRQDDNVITIEESQPSYNIKQRREAHRRAKEYQGPPLRGTAVKQYLDAHPHESEADEEGDDDDDDTSDDDDEDDDDETNDETDADDEVPAHLAPTLNINYMDSQDAFGVASQQQPPPRPLTKQEISKLQQAEDEQRWKHQQYLDSIADLQF